MNGHQIQSKIISMEIDVLNAVRQRTLDQWTDGPFVKESRLFFLLLPYFNGEQWSAKMDTSANTVAIVYAALHAHDKVKEEMPISKEQQLTVLAGDLYSGIYYQMLAKLKNMEMVQKLAAAIIQVSEKKASFHEHRVQQPEEVEETVKVIETALLNSFYEVSEFGNYRELMECSLLYQRYTDELEALKTGQFSYVLSLLSETMVHSSLIEQWLMERLDALSEQILLAANDCQLDFEVKAILLDQIIPHQHSAEQLTREG
ncbi:heptaprenyl diphosphate synthase component 1 [Planococcus sp. ISL-109]|uniref:heptaprenyl diphosphate synthase component 1 n=1 Tax=Planococcus sp. ISL-109 TaxID=2819166 RepID=UPI001BE63597|nr:heptaprenyl diphosphate synthase component 1 [Planococcus sp. ISL-109]MBT2582041.1 heptaprenyl diphosphate synthase component 1 [Planococcus sp. ISL-109]